MISILRAVEPQTFCTLDKVAVENLNLRQVIRAFAANDDECQYVLDTVCTLDQNSENIMARQLAVQDFKANPKLMQALKKALSEVKEVKGAVKELSKNSVYSRAVFDEDSRHKARTTFGNLSDISRALLRLLRIYVNIEDILSNLVFQSVLLQNLKIYFEKFAKSPEFNKFGKLIHAFSHIEADNSDICVSVSLYQEPGKMNVAFTSLNGMSVNGESFRVRIEQETVQRLIGKAVDELCKYLSETAESMVSQLTLLGGELQFYNFALRFDEILREKNIPCLYPQTAASWGDAFFENMYSINLIAKDTFYIVPNSVSLQPLTVICGDNNSGKTCYLEGLAQSQIFAQAGLPVGAAAGKIFPVSDILTQFAAEEKKLGRFEEEVREVATMLKKVDERTLVLFNETFQSTVYEEIAGPFKNILDALVLAGAYTVTVSHNEFFIDMCKADPETVLYHMGEDHTLIFSLNKV